MQLTANDGELYCTFEMHTYPYKQDSAAIVTVRQCVSISCTTIHHLFERYLDGRLPEVCGNAEAFLRQSS